jgi:hypothetical protein
MNAKKTTATPPKKPLPQALDQDKIAEKLAEIAKANAEARATLEKHLGPERWPKLRRQSITQGVTDERLTVLCGKMVRTRQDWHPTNTAAALQGACNGLIIALGGTLTDADVTAYEEAVKAA